MIRWLWLTSLGLLQKQCDHPDEWVTVDLTEGGSAPIKWCRACGAFSFGGRLGGWFKPYPLWLRGKGERP
jgi:hypothetical protein